MSAAPPKPLVTRRLLGVRALVHFYRRRLRAHGLQEALAGVGIAAAVALVLAASLAQGSIVHSTQRVLRGVIGPANLQVRARGPRGFPEGLLARVEAVPGVERAAPLLERSVRVIGPQGKTTSVYLAGTDVSLGVLNGLGRTLPLNAVSEGALGLSRESARSLGVSGRSLRRGAEVTVLIGGVKRAVRVGAVLGSEAVGSLAGAEVAVMSLSSMQQLVGEPGRVTRILVQARPGARSQVEKALDRLVGGRLIVAGAEQDLSLLSQALGPSAQASDLFAVIGALLGLLFAFNAILLTVPERRQAIADLRMAGTRRSAIVQLVGFQAICLGVAASILGLAVGYALSRWVFHQSTGYLAQAFTLSGGTVVSGSTVLLAGLGGVLVTCVASALPLADLRRGAPRDAIFLQSGLPGGALGRRAHLWCLGAALAMLVLASVLYAAAPSGALEASIALALATVLAVPIAFVGVLALARAISEHAPRLPTLAIALGGVRATTLRALALAATGAVALFGSVALGGARANLLSGIHGFAGSYAADAPIWISEPEDNQATRALAGDGGARKIAGVPGVASIERFHGAFLTVGRRRVWVLARPPGGARDVLASQTLGGQRVAVKTERLLAEGGWIAISRQIASEHHVGVGGKLSLPAPRGMRTYRVAALTTNLAWSPGVVFIGSADFQQAWGTSAPSALAVHLSPGINAQRTRAEIVRALGPSSGLEVSSAAQREQNIDRLTGEGLSQLALVSSLLVLTAIIALAAALTSSIQQRRSALAGLRLAGAPPARLRRILLLEASLILAAGCITGALAGIYGQFVMDAYLRHVTGFPVSSAGGTIRAIEIVALVLFAALAIVAVPGWLASRVSPALALAEE
jgi:putative ABC transport system permease protein